MANKKHHSFSHYFLKGKLGLPQKAGYRTSLVLLIINKNKTDNENKLLFVKQANGFWNPPKEGMKAENIADDFFTTITRNIEEELGFRGMKVVEAKPLFQQKAFIFDFFVQKYDKDRSDAEKKKLRPHKGKCYHLAVMYYTGPDSLPVTPNDEVADFAWVDETEGNQLLKDNMKLYEAGKIESKHSVLFGIELFKKVMRAYKILEDAIEEKDIQKKLF